jgi:hypothetical protein
LAVNCKTEANKLGQLAHRLYWSYLIEQWWQNLWHPTFGPGDEFYILSLLSVLAVSVIFGVSIGATYVFVPSKAFSWPWLGHLIAINLRDRNRYADRRIYRVSFRIK